MLKCNTIRERRLVKMHMKVEKGKKQTNMFLFLNHYGLIHPMVVIHACGTCNSKINGKKKPIQTAREAKKKMNY